MAPMKEGNETKGRFKDDFKGITDVWFLFKGKKTQSKYDKKVNICWFWVVGSCFWYSLHSSEIVYFF